MGCDIHLHTEIKINGKWEHYSQPRIERDYALFSKMAGVRSRDDSPKAIVPCRGLPSDCSATVRFCSDYDGIDGHSHSYLSGQEIIELWKWLESKTPFLKEIDLRREWGYLFGNCWGWFYKYREDYPVGIEDIRYVFWFDN